MTAPGQPPDAPFRKARCSAPIIWAATCSARLLWGTRLSLAVGIAAALMAALSARPSASSPDSSAAVTDNLIMRGIDMLMAFPYILLALAIVAALGPGLLNALYAVAVVNIPFFARNIRGVTVGLARPRVRRRRAPVGQGPPEHHRRPRSCPTCCR